VWLVQNREEDVVSSSIEVSVSVEARQIMNIEEYKIYALEKREITCVDVEKLIGEYFDGDLPVSIKARVDAHVEGCECCKRSHREYSLLIDMAGELRADVEPMSIAAQNKLRQALNQELGISMPMLT